MLTVVLEDVVRFAVVIVGIANHLEGIADALWLAIAIVEPQTAVAADEAGIAHAAPPAIWQQALLARGTQTLAAALLRGRGKWHDMTVSLLISE